MRLSSWIAIFGMGASLACGAAGSPGTDRDGDAGPPPSDATGGVDTGNGPSINGPFQPAIVFVNGLVTGAAADLTLRDVRICIENVTPHPLPDDRPMPLANYPGVALGQGVDLGAVQGLPSNTVTIDVFNASDLSDDATWTPQRLDCTFIACSADAGPTCRPHVSLQVSLLQAVNLVVLSDAPQGVQLRSTPLDGNYQGTPGSIQAQIANYAGWHDGDEVAAEFGQLPSKTIATTLATALESSAASAMATLDVPAEGYENYGVWVSQQIDGAPGDTFGQSLGSIQWVSNPTTAPSAFYEVRENFALVLVGDPNNLLVAANGRDPSFDGRALHIVAVPFAAGVSLSP